MSGFRWLVPLLLPVIVLSLLLAVAAWPAVHLAPRDVRIGLLAPEPLAADSSARLDSAGFEVQPYADASLAITAIEDRDIYGAIILSGDEPQVLIASAASPVVAEILRSVAGQIAGTTSPIAPSPVDVVPLPSSDPRGAGFTASLFPLFITAILTAVATVFTVRAPARRLLVLTLSSLLSAVVAAVLMREWLAVLGDADWLSIVAVIGLAMLTLATLTAGLYMALGFAGIGLGAALIIMIGNPLSGATSSPDLLPGWASLTGSLLPPGAFATLLRSAAFFGGSGGSGPLLILLVWLALGVVLLGRPLIQERRRRSRHQTDADPVSPASPAAQGSTPAS